MRRAILCVATGDHYRRGMERLGRILAPSGIDCLFWNDLPHPKDGDHPFPSVCVRTYDSSWPSHQEKPYAFKACALQWAAERGYVGMLWLDSAIKPVRPLDDLWAYIVRQGYWLAQNCCQNYVQTADSAYPALFPEYFHGPETLAVDMEAARTVNKGITHVIACSFGLDLNSDKSKVFLHEYRRLALETNAFLGPWANANNPTMRQHPSRTWPCGPPDVHAHRHDQTAASVIAWRLGMQLTLGHAAGPTGEFLAYPEWFTGRVVPSGVTLVHDGTMTL